MKTLMCAIVALLFLLPSLCVPSLLAQGNSFLLTTESFEPYIPAYVGNGYFSYVTSRLGTDSTASFMAGVYDHVEGDIPRIAELPAWSEVNLFDGRNWLNETTPNVARISSYQQTLNMYDGFVQTKYRWVDGERASSIEVIVFVSRSNPHLAVERFRVTPHYGGQVKLRLPVRAWEAPNRVPLARLDSEAFEALTKRAGPTSRYPGYMVVEKRQVKVDPASGFLRMVSRAQGGTTAVAEDAAVAWPADLKEFVATGIISNSGVSIELGFEAQAEETYTFYKYVSAVSSLDTPSPSELADNVARDARARGYDSVFEEHALAWHRIWQTDIVVEENPELQRAIHSVLFYLLCSAGVGTGFDIPPMGLSSIGYNGHIFWDSDTFMFPVLLALHPDMAESLVMFRNKTLGAAKINARLNGYKGAMYPWEADELGSECTPRFAWQNALQENHVTGWVALAEWQYYLATGDKEWLAKYGYPVIEATADFWASRVIYNEKKTRYEIRNVVSSDEGSQGVDNDSVTNAIARKNLQIAITASQLLGERANDAWQKIADGIYIPYDETSHFYPEFEGAPPWKAGTAIGHVVPLLNYPLELPMDKLAERNDLNNAIESFTSTGGGTYILPTIYPIIAAELGDSKLVDELLTKSYRPYLKPPFNVLNEGPTGESIVFLTGTGFLQQFIYGYTGLRWTENGLTPKFSATLPTSVKKLQIMNISIRGKKYDILVDGNGLKRVAR